jgi:cytochrome c553
MSSARLAGLIGLALAAGSAGALAAESVPLAAQGCVGCHGVRGSGSLPTPGIAGRPASEIIGAMKAFGANERPGTIMGRIARGYTEAEITAIAAYFAAQR